jgi:hypothetical protein
MDAGACVVRVFATKSFDRFSRRERIGSDRLREAVDRAERGLIDADLGGGVIKQRLARKGQGRSGGYRVLLVYREGVRAVFLYGFAKNERENINDDELARLRRAGDEILSWRDKRVEALVAAREWTEIECSDQEERT